MNDENSYQYHTECTHQTSGMLDNAADNTNILMITDIQPFVNLTEHDILFLSAVGLQDKRTHHGTKRQCHNRRKQYRYSNGNSKLAI